MAGRLILVVLLLLAAACAEVGRPPGGPIDDIPPSLATVSPSSLATRVTADEPLSFTFSEKVDRRRFSRSLVIVPDLPLAPPEFDGLEVRVQPLFGWPADSTVVWVLLPSLPDKHGVGMERGASGAFTTGESLPPGGIRGRAVLDSLVNVGDDGPDWAILKARLTLDPLPDSRQRRPWRFADGSEDGSFELQWLRLPSGPYQLQVWLDSNGDSRRDEREPVATVDSLFVGLADSMLEIDGSLLRLVDLEAPVPVRFCLDSLPDAVAIVQTPQGEVAQSEGDSVDSVDSVVVTPVRVVLWTWPDEASSPVRTPVDSTGCIEVELAPGDTRWGAWLDLDGDLHWSNTEDGSSEPFVAADTLLVQPATPLRLPVAWPEQRLQWGALDSLRILPVPREAWSESSS